jgi:GT2 family glycosyltransferase
MEPAPECLAGHLRAQSAGPRRGIIGAAPIRWDSRALPVVAQYVGPKFNAHLQRLAQPGHQLSLRDFYSGNFSIRRAVLLSVGLFDEAFKIYGNEDLELSLRLVRAGVTLGFSAEALAYQHYTKDFSGLARDTLAKGQTAVLLASKHPEAFPYLQLSRSQQGSRAWRWLRAGLLAASRRQAALPPRVIGLTRWLERRPSGLLPHAYRLTLDYCYWLGVETALAENRRQRQGLQTLAGPTWA